MRNHGLHAERVVLSLPLVFLPIWTSVEAQVPLFIRGDMNLDGVVNLIDASHFVDFRFFGDAELRCGSAADVDDDGKIDMSNGSDLFRLMDWLLRGPSAAGIPAPFPEAGRDPTPGNLLCLDDEVIPRPDPHPGFELGWRAEPIIARGGNTSVLLLATTAAPIVSFSAAYRLDKRYVDDAAVDLDETIFPGGPAGKAYAASPAFQWQVVPSADPDFDLLLVGAILVSGLSRAQFGSSNVQPLDFDATRKPIGAAPIIRLRLSIREDAPLGPIRLLTPALPDDYPGAIVGDVHHGLGNSFGVARDLGFQVSTEPQFSDDLDVVIADGDEFLRGDFDRDGRINITDATATLNHLFGGGNPTFCPDAADTNDDGLVQISDPIFTLGFLFLGTVSLPAPTGSSCGSDPTPDMLGCLAGCAD